MNRRSPSIPARQSALAVLALLAGLVLPGAALAAAPGASTGSARQVGYGTAVLTGTVTTGGSATSYYFQYGTTRGYGGQTAVGSAAGEASPTAVAEVATGLAPATTYHYRLVATGPGGTSVGGDRTVVTAAVPLTVTLAGSPAAVGYGGATTIEGTVAGTGAAGREVLLQDDPFGSPLGFEDVGGPAVTTPAGGFAFPLAGLSSTARYRVVVVANPPVVSAAVTVPVAVLVVSHVHRAGRGRARFYGTVTPAQPGMQVGIMRIAGGREHAVAGALLRGSAGSSRFSVLAHVRPGRYRVFARITGGALVSAYGRTLVIG